MLKTMKRALDARTRRAQARIDLHRLVHQSEHMLRDIGVTRDGLRHAVLYGRWQD